MNREGNENFNFDIYPIQSPPDKGDLGGFFLSNAGGV